MRLCWFIIYSFMTVVEEKKEEKKKKTVTTKITFIPWWNYCLEVETTSAMLIVREVWAELSVLIGKQFTLNSKQQRAKYAHFICILQIWAKASQMKWMITGLKSCRDRKSHLSCWEISGIRWFLFDKVFLKLNTSLSQCVKSFQQSNFTQVIYLFIYIF